MAGKQGGQLQLHFKVPLEGVPPKDLRSVAYVFDRRGALLGAAAIEGETAKLSIDAGEAASARLLIGPELPPHRKGETPTVERLQGIGAYEPAWRFDPKRPIQDLIPIPERLWRPWFWCRCLVRGQVVRRVSVAGVLEDLPVCHARVHICEVDPIIIILKRLPDDLILRLRDELLVELHRPIPIPDPPPFVIDPGWIDPSPENLARRDLSRVRIGLLETVQPLAADGIAEAETAQPLILRTESPTWLRSTSVSSLRASLLANVDFIRPYLCWPWIWPWYRCDEFAVLETNADGRFETTFGYPCFGDKPDIYVWVEFSIGGVWTAVYKPPIACNTRWDYLCGDDITIRLTDPRVPVCGEPPESPGKSVTIVGIGENVSTHELQMTAPGASQGLTTAGEPFGGVLEPRVLFGRTALLAAGITHYRWSYRRLTASDGTTSVSDPNFHHLDHAVTRHYAVPSGLPGVGPSYPIEPMGPEFGSSNLFKIQPFTPSAAGTDGWVILDSHTDNASAFFPTNLLNTLDPEAVAGRYELKLELFKIVGGIPAVVDLTAQAVELFIPDQDAPFGALTVTTSPPASPEFYFKDPVSHHTMAFRLVVRIDNNVCHGNIIDVNVAGVGAGPCGFIEYHHHHDATISFMASHPHDFATFGFNVYRGAGCPVSSASGHVGDAIAGSYTRSGVVFSDDVTVHTLLTTTSDPINCPPCVDKAAFAESLAVYAMATDGWYRLAACDAPRGGPTERANKAFALEPHP